MFLYEVQKRPRMNLLEVQIICLFAEAFKKEQKKKNIKVELCEALKEYVCIKIKKNLKSADS